MNSTKTPIPVSLNKLFTVLLKPWTRLVKIMNQPREINFLKIRPRPVNGAVPTSKPKDIMVID